MVKALRPSVLLYTRVLHFGILVQVFRVFFSAGYHDISPKRLLFVAFFSPKSRCTSMALINTPLERIRVFFLLLLGENMLLLSSLRVAREVEKQPCLPTDGQKEIFIWSPCAELQERTRASSAHARTVSRWWRYYIHDASFCRGGL